MAATIAEALNHPEISETSILKELAVPPDMKLGHLALPCYRLSKILKKSSTDIAHQISSHLSPELKALVTGPYVNFSIEKARLVFQTLSEIGLKGDRYGSDTLGGGKKIVIEYCSPNIAKKLAFHHIRSTLIGNALAHVYSFLGFQVERINFVGDWGAQFARLLSAFDEWGDRALLSESDAESAMQHLSDLYVRFHKDLESHPERTAATSQRLQQLEEKKQDVVKLWQLIRGISLRSMEKTLKRMDIKFDVTEGESRYLDDISKILPHIKGKGGAILSEGAWIIEISGITTPALIQKKDGTTLYLTRDIAAALDRFQRFHFEKMFYVVSDQQRLHFQLLFGVLKKMGYEWSDRCEHVGFGTVFFGSEKMSTREGRVILLDDLLDEAKLHALEECTQKNPELQNKEEIAEQVGIGAVIFSELFAHRTREIEFDWKNALAFDGETGPYVQYAHVRCSSLLEKAGTESYSLSENDFILYNYSLEEEALVLTLAKFRHALFSVIAENEPYHLTHFLIDLAKALNRFYYKLPVLQASDPIQKELRLRLVRATQQTLKSGMQLLGIPCPHEM